MRQHGLADQPKSSLVLDGFLEAAQRSVSELARKIDQETLERAVEILAGSRDDLPDRAAALVPDHLLSWATPWASSASATSWSTRVAGMGAEQAASSAARDAVLAVSFTPYASETVALTNAARPRAPRSCRSPIRCFRRSPRRPTCCWRSSRRISKASARWRRPWRWP